MSRTGNDLTRAYRQRAALALVGLLVAALLGAEAHRVVALHVVCSKHGELIHVYPGVPRVASRPVADAFTAGPTAALEGAHGCAALLFLATAVVAPGPITPRLAPRLVATRGVVRLPTAAPHAVPLLLQAPKLSPPAA